MSPQSRKRKKKSGHPARRVSTGRATGLAVLESLRSDYVAWAERGGWSKGEANEDWDLVVDFAADYAAVAPFGAPDAFEPRIAAALLDKLDPEDAEIVDGVLDEYVHFMDETGRWTRGDEALDDLHDLVAPHDLPDLDLSELTVEESWAAWQGIPLLARGRRLLEWLGPGRDVTEAGGVRSEDLAGAAAAVGTDADGAATMDDVLPLELFWNALRTARLVEVADGRARPTGPTADLLPEPAGEDFEEADDAASSLAIGFMLAAVGTTFGAVPTDSIGAVPADSAHAMVAAALFKGATGSPLPSTVLDGGSAGLGAWDLPDGSGEAARARQLLAQVRDVGLIVPGPDLAVTPVAAHLAVAAAAEVLAAAESSDDPSGDG